ncbi:MAG: hypothetical protein RM021_009355 [Nostoc sp. EkiNYC01]|nr:hypothetical protein [Nostoc sp. EkiNYC01]
MLPIPRQANQQLGMLLLQIQVQNYRLENRPRQYPKYLKIELQSNKATLLYWQQLLLVLWYLLDCRELCLQNNHYLS